MHYITAHSLGGRREALTPRSCLWLWSTLPGRVRRRGQGLASRAQSEPCTSSVGARKKQGIWHSVRAPLCPPAAWRRCVLPRPDSLRALYLSLRASGVRVRRRSSPPATWIIQSTKYRLLAIVCSAEIWILLAWRFEFVVAKIALCM